MKIYMVSLLHRATKKTHGRL